jgi:hypothetical protein
MVCQVQFIDENCQFEWIIYNQLAIFKYYFTL